MMDHRLNAVKDFVRLHGLNDPTAEAAIRDVVGTYESEIAGLKSRIKAYETLVKVHGDYICLNANDLFVRGADAVLIDCGDIDWAIRIIEKFPKEGATAVKAVIAKSEPLPGRAGREYKSAMNFIRKHENTDKTKFWSFDLNDLDSREMSSVDSENIRLKKELFKRKYSIFGRLFQFLSELKAKK